LLPKENIVDNNVAECYGVIKTHVMIGSWTDVMITLVSMRFFVGCHNLLSLAIVNIIHPVNISKDNANWHFEIRVTKPLSTTEWQQRFQLGVKVRKNDVIGIYFFHK